MTQLSLGDNNLEGSLPSELGMLTALGGAGNLYFEFNSLTGTFPSEIGLLTNLKNRAIDFEGNVFTGLLPSELGQLSGELRAHIHTASLEVDSHFHRVAVLTYYFDFEDNSFSGLIPSELGQLPITSWFSLTSNQFCGLIPSEVAALSTQLDSWMITSSNSIGTPCPSPAPTSVPTSLPTSFPTISQHPTVSSAPTSVPSPVPTELCNSPGKFPIINHTVLFCRSCCWASTAGLFLNGAVCESCPAGRFGNATSSAWITSCYLCDAGRFVARCYLMPHETMKSSCTCAHQVYELIWNGRMHGLCGGSL